MMQNKIVVDRFIRTQQSLQGSCQPGSLERLKPFLVQEGGDIHYTVTGHQSVDAAARLVNRLKCIITGWFWLADAATLEPLRYEVGINSRLVVVKDESELPPLGGESFEEDYITLAAEVDVLELVEEEILLDLPLWAISQPSSEGGAQIGIAAKKQLFDPSQTSHAVQPAAETSPFAELAKWKKK